jgi:acyl-CoA thioesterase-1
MCLRDKVSSLAIIGIVVVVLLMAFYVPPTSSAAHIAPAENNSGSSGARSTAKFSYLEDFRNGLSAWSTSSSEDVRLIPNVTLPGQSHMGGQLLLHLRKVTASRAAAATLKFPFAARGSLVTELRFAPGFGGAVFDISSEPESSERTAQREYTLCLSANGQLQIAGKNGWIDTTASVRADSWNLIQVDWDCRTQRAQLYLNGRPLGEIEQRGHPARGLSYFSIHSKAVGDEPAGIYLRSVSTAGFEDGLPNILLIGDSITLGYAPEVRRRLDGRANVYVVPGNGSSTAYGLRNVDMWLAGRHWDVIHFNWGLHDLTLLDHGYQVGVDEYAANLRSLLKQLKSTGARLIWATTTPVQVGAERRSPKDPARYNDAARRIMEEQSVPTDDLHRLVLPHLSTLQLSDNVHFKPVGNQKLGRAVADCILRCLKNEQDLSLPGKNNEKN